MEFEFDSPPASSQWQQVCDGIRWIRLALPFALDHVNCWLLGDAEDSWLIDTGVDNAATRTLWNTVWSRAGYWPNNLLVTHFHPDHAGLAGWFEQRGCENFTGSEIEIEVSDRIWQTSAEAYVQLYVDWYRANGLPQSVIAAVQQSGNTYRAKVHEPVKREQWNTLVDGQTLELAGRQYTVIIGRGHAPDMLMLFRSDDNVLIAADQVLPSISPNVSVMPRLPDTNPLESFLHSLKRLESLPDDTLVLPSHGLPFRGLKQRLHALQDHHAARLDTVHKACATPHTAFELFPILFRRALDAQQTSFALGETLAHLHHLEHRGLVQRQNEAGVDRFHSTL